MTLRWNLHQIFVLYRISFFIQEKKFSVKKNHKKYVTLYTAKKKSNNIFILCQIYPNGTKSKKSL